VRLVSLQYYDKVEKWGFDKINFDALTLLVGASGVGKTKILKAVSELVEIAKGKSINKSINWTLSFEIENYSYLWEGSSSFIRDNYKDNLENINEFIEIDSDGISLNSESLQRIENNNTLDIFRRENEKIIFSNKEVPKTNSDKSLISIFSEEESIKSIIQGLNNIFIFNFEKEKDLNPSISSLTIRTLKELAKNKKSIAFKAVSNSNISNIAKLIYANESLPEIFEEIKDEFIDIFNRVVDIRLNKKLNSITKKNEKSNEVNKSFIYFIEIKEEGTDHWVNQSDISAGMFKTLLFISLIKLTPKDSVIIVDEFENSLGINCIDLVADSLLENEKQFILTSHHPYIINRIPLTNWKIVTREGGQVAVKSATEYRLGQSKHEAFKELINLEAFREGSE
jgi:predicted ATPase